MNGPVTEAGAFLVTFIFGIALVMVMLRFLLQLTRADFFNPLSQAVVKTTNPVLRPLRRVIPGIAGLDMASVVVLLVLQALEITVLRTLYGGGLATLGLLVLSLARLVDLAYWIFVIAIFIQVVVSWVSPGAYNPVTQVVYSLTRPLLRPLRGRAEFSGIDFSPMIVLLGLGLLRILFIKPLLSLGHQMI